MGRVKDMELAIREADISKLKGEEAVLTEAAKLLVTLQDVLSGIVSEHGVEALARYTRAGGILIGRSGQVALALKAMADRTANPRCWVLTIRTMVIEGEAPQVSVHRTLAGARAAMERDIRETLDAGDPHFDEEDVIREDADNVMLGEETRYEIRPRELCN